ncbi:lytic transglycosylase domain-containing protein [Raoultella terrigena]|uniref:lytic transglycosylase domain-containing protein n=1 Tax=Raoultella terrigena TaxID=577 RepID=UPI000907DBBE|nr:lytic transglycosylase domain-containing protein [Raoultella terrigena]
MLTSAAFLSLAMQCAPSVHPDTIHDITKTESSFNPYAIAEIVPLEGSRSRVLSYTPTTKETALQIVKEIEKRKNRYSVGVMQITSTNFPVFNVNAEKMFNPCENLRIAEKIIIDCYKRGGSLIRMLSCYYSGNFETGQRPEKAFNNTSYVQRIGYVVPSTKQDKIAVQNGTQGSLTADNTTYPSQVIRGALPDANKSNTYETNYPQQIVRGKLLTPK